MQANGYTTAFSKGTLVVIPLSTIISTYSTVNSVLAFLGTFIAYRYCKAIMIEQLGRRIIDKEGMNLDTLIEVSCQRLTLHSITTQ
jgi:uncharacterized membrane protein